MKLKKFVTNLTLNENNAYHVPIGKLFKRTLPIRLKHTQWITTQKLNQRRKLQHAFFRNST